jgi:hypothetical protein
MIVRVLPQRIGPGMPGPYAAPLAPGLCETDSLCSIGLMEIVLLLILAAIGGAILRMGFTLAQINRNLEQIASGLSHKP